MAAFLVQPLLVSQADSDNEDDGTYSEDVRFTAASSPFSSTCDKDSDTYSSTPHDETSTTTDSDIDSGIEPVIIKFTPKMARIANQKEVDKCYKNTEEWENYDFEKTCMGAGNLEWSLYVKKYWSEDRDYEGKRYEVLKAGVACLNGSHQWEADAHVELNIVNSSGKELSAKVHQEFDWDDDRVETNLGVWKALISREYGCVDAEGRFNIECKISFRSLTGVILPKRYDFSSPSRFSDVILNVRGSQLHVSKQVLAVASPVFETLFFGDWKEKDSEEITIKKVGYKDFVGFLTQIYSPNTPITAGSVESLLSLADRYATEAVTEKAERFLLSSDDDFCLAKKLLFADKYRLVNLQDYCVSELDSMDKIKKLWGTAEYGKVSDQMKVALFENVMLNA